MDALRCEPASGSIAFDVDDGRIGTDWSWRSDLRSDPSPSLVSGVELVSGAETTPIRRALAQATEDLIVFDLDGIANQYTTLLRELPGVAVRFAMKACPVDEVLGVLSRQGCGVDAASPQEISQALRAGVPVERIHYGNTIKSDRNIAEAYRLGVRDFATDSPEDLAALAVHAPGSRVFCRIATTGEGAVWGLSRKFGCSPRDAIALLEASKAKGLTPSGLSLHVGSQQMTPEAWDEAIGSLCLVITELNARGIMLDHVNLGGGLPALGCLDRHGVPLNPPLGDIFAAIRAGMTRIGHLSRSPLRFLIEPGRYLVADHGAIRAHVARLSSRSRTVGECPSWLYLSCGKFNGLYEIDELRYRLEFPSHLGGEYIPAMIAGPTCDSEDAYAGVNFTPVPRALSSGDPVWILSCGAYAVSYATRGFNGFSPLPCAFTGGVGNGAR